MPNQSFYIESTANKTQEYTKYKKGKSTFLIVVANEFARDLEKIYFVYPIDILQIQTETKSNHGSLWVLNIL